jgi:hypothetical protein
MSKNNPKTIADLKINYTFTDYESENEGIFKKHERFKKANKSILKYTVAPRTYTFHLGELVFDFYNNAYLTDLPRFIEWLNFELVDREVQMPLKLDHFELLSENTFRIHIK